VAEISEEQVSAAYTVGREWLTASITRTEAVNLLATEHGLNRVSAGDLLQVLKAMVAGERFTRSISAPAAAIFLKRLNRDHGSDLTLNAVAALDQHIAYYEEIRPVTLHKLRAVTDEWRTAANPAQFEFEVSKMLEAPAAERKGKLPPAGTKPKVSYAQVKVFQRSPAVVAEVLLRAQGNCETCKQPAPFARASDGQPYLEVHHVVKLADGGEDTVANAIAVCPNCHRRHHFG
jgi:5-methylcytosine-specific restriction protein A